MENTEISIEFDSLKLKALRYYLSKNGLDVEDELQKHLESVFNKQVPKDVKEYLGHESGEELSPEKTEEMTQLPRSDDESQSGKKSTRKQKETAPKDESAEQESKVMTMNL